MILTSSKKISKKFQLKWLTMSVFALGAVTVLPIVATACSNNNDEDIISDNNTTTNDDINSGDDIVSNDEIESTETEDNVEVSDNNTNSSSTLPITNPVTEYEYKELSDNLISFVGYYGDGNNPKSDMNAVVRTITSNSVNDVTTDESGIWKNSGIVLPDDYSYLRYTLIINDNFTYIKKFISVADWYNQITDSSLADKFDTNYLNYDVLADWDVSLILNVYSYSSYEFILTIAPKESNTEIDTYQFMLYTKDNFDNQFPDGVSKNVNTTGDISETANLPITNPIIEYKYKEISDNTMSFLGYYGDGNNPKDEMNDVVNKITPSIDDITEDDISGVWKNTGIVLPNDHSYIRYTLIIDDNFTYIKNFIEVTNWYNQITDSSLADKFDTNYLNYDVLADWDVSLILNVYSYSSYEFILTIAPKESNTEIDTYQFMLYTKDNFANTIPNDSRGEASENYFVDNLKNYYVDSNNTMSFAGYYDESLGSTKVTENFNKIVNIITPSVSDIENDESGTWLKTENSDGSYIYTLEKFNDESEGVNAYQYIINFIDGNNTYLGWWKNLNESNELLNELDLIDIDDNSLYSNYDIELVITFNSKTSYNFVCTLTSKDNEISYQFMLYTYYEYYENYLGNWE